MLTANKRILLTDAGVRAVLGTWRSLERAGWEIVASSTANDRRYLAEIQKRKRPPLFHPDPGKSVAEFTHWLTKYSKENPQDLVLPINEASVYAAEQCCVAGGNRSRFVMPAHDSLKYSLCKYNATHAAMNAGIAVPTTSFIRGPGSSELPKAPSSVAFPLVVKWDNVESPEGQYVKGSHCVVHSQEQLEAVLAELAPSKCAVMAQELVGGKGVGAFFLRHKGEVVLRFAHRRLHEVPWTGGVSAFCESSADHEVLEAGERLLDSINYQGVAMVEFRKEPGKSPVFLEINGRLWGSLGLALRAGADFPKAMVECHMNDATNVVQPDLNRRVRWRDLELELAHFRSLRKSSCEDGGARPNGVAAVASFLWHTVSPRTKGDYFKWSDLGQGLLAYWKIFRSEAGRLKYRLRSIPLERQEQLAMERYVSQSQIVLADLKANKPETILFLCYGNICRSSYAEYRWNELRSQQDELPRCVSAGFHDQVERSTPPRFQSAARHRGVELRDHRSKRVNQRMIDDAGLVVVMDRRNWLDVACEYPHATSRTVLLGVCDEAESPEVPDPYGEPIPAGGYAYQRIDRALDRLKRCLSEEASGSSKTLGAATLD